MGKILKVEERVRKILVHNPQTRNDDNLLIYEYLSTYHDINNVSIKELLLNSKQLGIPSFETITRARRKVQECSPYLKATEKIDKIRMNREKEFVDYALGDKQWY